MLDGRLSRPRHCRKGAQPVPKAVHRSGCRDKHNWPRPLTPQSIMPSLNHCDLLRHVGVKNLPKVVTRQRRGWELNSQPWSCKSNALTTRLPSHLYVSGVCVLCVCYEVWNVSSMQLKGSITGLNHWVRALATSHNYLYGGSYQTIKVPYIT